MFEQHTFPIVESPKARSPLLRMFQLQALHKLYVKSQIVLIFPKKTTKNKQTNIYVYKNNTYM